MVADSDAQLVCDVDRDLPFGEGMLGSWIVCAPGTKRKPGDCGGAGNRHQPAKIHEHESLKNAGILAIFCEKSNFCHTFAA